MKSEYDAYADERRFDQIQDRDRAVVIYSSLRLDEVRPSPGAAAQTPKIVSCRCQMTIADLDRLLWTARNARMQGQQNNVSVELAMQISDPSVSKAPYASKGSVRVFILAGDRLCFQSVVNDGKGLSLALGGMFYATELMSEIVDADQAMQQGRACAATADGVLNVMANKSKAAIRIEDVVSQFGCPVDAVAKKTDPRYVMSTVRVDALSGFALEWAWKTARDEPRLLYSSESLRAIKNPDYAIGTDLIVNAIEEYKIVPRYYPLAAELDAGAWVATASHGLTESRGVTLAEALIRCAVKDVIGEFVRLPTVIVAHHLESLAPAPEPSLHSASIHGIKQR